MFLLKTIVVLISASYIFCEIVSDVGIIGGHRISIEKVPFIASLRLNGTVHWCGSSIIHERFVLTAAHCIVDNRKYKVLVGTDKIDEGGQLYDVDKIIIHEKYSNITNDYDICLIKLNETLTFGSKVKIISLSDTGIVKKGMWLNTTGWGYTVPKGPISKDLRQVKIPVVPWLSCQFQYRKSYKITPRMICAGGNGKDSCMGDSGGPLTWGDVQIGITSFGAGCGVLPGVYTKISTLKSWITQTIEQNL